MKSTNSKYVQYGCGWSSAPGWENFDSSPTLRFERLPLIGRLYTKNDERFPEAVRYGDIVKGLPLSDGVCLGVYCSHVLEHLSLSDFRKALVNTRKLLKPGGIFRLVVPDLEFYIDQYCRERSVDSAIKFMRGTMLGQEERPKSCGGVLSDLFGGAKHLWMWDFYSIKNELECAGFSSVRRAYFGDSKDSRFKEVEAESRWKDALGVECTVE